MGQCDCELKIGDHVKRRFEGFTESHRRRIRGRGDLDSVAARTKRPVYRSSAEVRIVQNIVTAALPSEKMQQLGSSRSEPSPLQAIAEAEQRQTVK